MSRFLKLGFVSLAAVTLSACLAGCGSSLGTQRLQYHDEYYVRSAGTHQFNFERRFGDGSSERGRMVYHIRDITWANPDGAGTSYCMAGAVDMNAGGTATTADSAFTLVPIERLKQAMEPANVPEVFVEGPVNLPGVKLEGSWTTITIHREKLRSLKLPIDFTRPPVQNQPFSSALNGRARDWADEVAMVWLKDMLLRLSLLNPLANATFTLTAIQETPDHLTLKMRHAAGPKVDEYTLTFQRGRSLVAVDGKLSDGSTLAIRDAATESATAPVR